MRFIVNEQPRDQIDVSFVLLDWSCRESFHILDYLADQTVDRHRYEIIWLEYYDKASPVLCGRIEAARTAGRPLPVDIYAVMEMSPQLCYHKHLMYNLGILLASGRVVCFCDSDAMVRPGFIEAILETFEQENDIVLHLDEVRNNHPSFHPFCYPAFEDVTGLGCVNWVNGRPAGLSDKADPLHTRNYGACMAAMRQDLIAIGGADMHIDYLGHICGPYEMTWRLINAGKRELWHQSEWLYHTWHPGQTGDENFAGPHDGMHLSTRALECLQSHRIQPWVENPAIKSLRSSPKIFAHRVMTENLIQPQWLKHWRFQRLGGIKQAYNVGSCTVHLYQSPKSLPDRRVASDPYFGRRPNWWVRFVQIPLLLRVLISQFRIKHRMVPWLRPNPATRNLKGKFRALLNFSRRIFAYDRYLFRQCWLALAYAAQEGNKDVVLYGEGDAARVLCALSKHLPVNITAICPFRGNPPLHLLGRPTISQDQLARTGDTIVVASFVNTPEHLERLKALDISRDRIITLQ